MNATRPTAPLTMRHAWLPDDLAGACGGLPPFGLIHADPAWEYGNRVPRGDGTLSRVTERYSTTGMAGIVATLDAAYDLARSDARLVCWCTFPQLADWMKASAGMRWKFKTGGAWMKTGRMGIGYHWRGDSEIVLVYTRGSTGRPPKAISNAHASPREAHSRKPAGFMVDMLEAWTKPGDSVLDLYAGLGGMAEACAATGRGYLGLEGDPERIEAARELLSERGVVLT